MRIFVFEQRRRKGEGQILKEVERYFVYFVVLVLNFKLTVGEREKEKSIGYKFKDKKPI